MTQECNEEEQFFEEEEEFVVSDNGCDELLEPDSDDAMPVRELTDTAESRAAAADKTITNILMDRFRPNTPTAIRLIQDLKKMMKSKEDELGFRASPFGNDLFSWEVQLFKFDKGSDIEKDLQQYQKQTGRNYIQLQVSFPPDYPISPPFVRVIQPRFKFHTGRVTVGGSLCTDILTMEGWSAAYDIESLFINITSAIIDGKPRIDFSNSTPYSIEEAKQAFVRVASDHGWKISNWLPKK